MSIVLKNQTIRNKVFHRFFVDFLKENNAYYNYLINKEEANSLRWPQGRLNGRELAPLHYLAREFFWNGTKQKDTYWRNLYLKWLDVIDELLVKNVVQDKTNYIKRSAVEQLRSEYNLQRL